MCKRNVWIYLPLYHQLNPQSPVAALRTMSFNINKVCMLPTRCILIYRVSHRTKSNYFAHRHWQADLCNGHCETGTEFLNTCYTNFVLHRAESQQESGTNNSSIVLHRQVSLDRSQYYKIITAFLKPPDRCAWKLVLKRNLRNVTRGSAVGL